MSWNTVPAAPRLPGAGARRGLPSWDPDGCPAPLGGQMTQLAVKVPGCRRNYAAGGLRETAGAGCLDVANGYRLVLPTSGLYVACSQNCRDPHGSHMCARVCRGTYESPTGRWEGEALTELPSDWALLAPSPLPSRAPAWSGCYFPHSVDKEMGCRVPHAGKWLSRRDSPSLGGETRPGHSWF